MVTNRMMERSSEEVLSFGSSDSPQVGAPLGNRQDAAEMTDLFERLRMGSNKQRNV